MRLYYVYGNQERLAFRAKLLYPGGTLHVPPFFVNEKKGMVIQYLFKFRFNEIERHEHALQSARDSGDREIRRRRSCPFLRVLVPVLPGVPSGLRKARQRPGEGICPLTDLIAVGKKNQG